MTAHGFAAGCFLVAGVLFILAWLEEEGYLRPWCRAAWRWIWRREAR